MPIIRDSSYRPPYGFKGPHRQTIFPAICRRVKPITLRRERIDTPDRDFLDLDWADQGSQAPLIVISHGLEGNSRQAYIQGLARTFFQAGWNVLAWNFRGCSGEVNRSLQTYHSGASADLDVVIKHVDQSRKYPLVVLAGFSLGGNLTLKYLGEQGAHLSPSVKACTVISVPCDLQNSAERLEHPVNRIYMLRFMKTLRQKIRAKQKQYPDQLDIIGLEAMRSFREFDNAYTAPIHGFSSAIDYWNRCSSKQFIPDVSVPTLIINALDDPFLGQSCYPAAEAEQSEHVFLETPKHGGHAGFVQFEKKGSYWSELRALDFLTNSLPLNV